MRQPRTRTMRLRRESWGFAIGSVFFAVGVIPWYAAAVGPAWDAATFFVGSIFFTMAAFIQLALSGRRPPRRSSSRADFADWWSAAVQFAGTLLFNVSTGAVLVGAIREASTASTGWRPDAWGSVAFLLSSIVALVAAYRRHELWDPDARTAHGTWLNMAGSIAFGYSRRCSPGARSRTRCAPRMPPGIRRIRRNRSAIPCGCPQHDGRHQDRRVERHRLPLVLHRQAQPRERAGRGIHR